MEPVFSGQDALLKLAVKIKTSFNSDRLLTVNRVKKNKTRSLNIKFSRDILSVGFLPIPAHTKIFFNVCVKKKKNEKDLISECCLLFLAIFSSSISYLVFKLHLRLSKNFFIGFELFLKFLFLLL